MTDQESIDILNSLIPPLNKVNLNHNVESSSTTPTALKSNQNGTATDNEKATAVAATGSNFSSGGGCPYFNGKVTTQSSGGLKKLPKNPEWQTSVSIASEPLSYTDYLHLDKILNAQYPVSQKYGNLAHDEHLFIVIHQSITIFLFQIFLFLIRINNNTNIAYELWFKQIIFELDSVISLLAKPVVDDRCILVVVSRIQRINMIWKLLNDQIHILETMAPTDFIDFRGYLSTASGFQSLQFRVFENKLGLAEV
jgi:tryptophan 2,3-dioxygenase